MGQEVSVNKRAAKFGMVFRTKTGMDPSRISRPPDEGKASEPTGRSNNRNCEYCGELVPALGYREHLSDACPKNPAYRTCERCGLRISTSRYNQHVASKSCRSAAEIAGTQAREKRHEQARKKRRAAKVGFVDCGTSAIDGEYFQEVFGIAQKWYSRRLQIERDSQPDSFDVDSFWADDKIAEDLICAMTKRAKLKPGTNEPVLRKGRPILNRSGLSRPIAAVAVSIVRKGVRSVRALQALCRKSNSLAHAAKQADQLGSTLGMVRRLAAAGLCANNPNAHKAKKAAIEGWENGGKVPASSARSALIASLYGQPVTSAQVDLLETALSAWEDSRRTSKTTPAPMKFDVIFDKTRPVSAKHLSASQSRSSVWRLSTERSNKTMLAKKRKVGRPPLPKHEVREKITPIRLQENERAAFEKAAQKAGLSLSEWIRQTLRLAIDTR
jgi:predicted HicB family RNase H-like nuclease